MQKALSHVTALCCLASTKKVDDGVTFLPRGFFFQNDKKWGLALENDGTLRRGFPWDPRSRRMTYDMAVAGAIERQMILPYHTTYIYIYRMSSEPFRACLLQCITTQCDGIPNHTKSAGHAEAWLSEASRLANQSVVHQYGQDRRDIVVTGTD